MSDQIEGGLAIAASVLVLLTAMVDPVISAGLAIAILVGFGAWRLATAKRH